MPSECISQARAPSVEQIVACIEDRDDGVRRAASLWATCKLGPGCSDCMHALTTAPPPLSPQVSSARGCSDCMHTLTTAPPPFPTGKLGPGLLGLHAAAIAKRLDDPILSVRKGSLEALGRVHPTQLLAFAPAIALRLHDPILSVRPR